MTLREMVGAELRPADNFRRYVNPVVVELRYSEIWKGPFQDDPTEAEVRFDLGDVQEFAFTPLFMVDEENRTVKAALIGEKNEREVLVHFRPTNFGETRFYADCDRLLKIVRLPD